MTTSPILDNNSPAFPAMGNMTYKGITGRDWFAGQVLTGIMANSAFTSVLQIGAQTRGQHEGELIADFCFEVADAMIARRNSTSTKP
jgi:hypothetical protein